MVCEVMVTWGGQTMSGLLKLVPILVQALMVLPSSNRQHAYSYNIIIQTYEHHVQENTKI
jgi:hypothetical protein